MDTIETTPVRSNRNYMATPGRPSIRVPPMPHHPAPYQQQQQQQTPDKEIPNEAEKTSFEEDNLDIIQKHSIHTLVFRQLKRTHEMFFSDINMLPPLDESLIKFKNSIKAKDQYSQVLNLVPNAAAKLRNEKKVNKNTSKALVIAGRKEESTLAPIDELKMKLPNPVNSSLVVSEQSSNKHQSNQQTSNQIVLASGLSIAPRKKIQMPRPDWHAPWKLFRVISGHTGWVRSIAVEPGNEWFATGANDRIIKIWDLASGKLKLSLTGHISPVRGLAVSPRQPYLFSCGEDKMVKCWDLEYNKVVRHYHGHLSGVYALSLHPTLDILVTGGRDSVARVWDMRTKAQIHSLGGHSNTVASIFCESTDPQVVTGSHDSTIRLWDIVAGKTISTLTNHKKSVRALVSHPKLSMFCSGSINSLKQWRLPEGNFIQNLDGHDAIVNALAINDDNVLVSGGDNGSMHFWDWRTGYNFQRLQSMAQSGSIDSECGIFALAFDQSSSRLISGEADKTIKIYKEDENSSEETHPINWQPDILKRKKF